jgi:hypothetical protein
MEAKIETFNKFLVGVHGDRIVMMNSEELTGSLSADDALLLAAYLVTLADPNGERFAKVLEAVQNA